MIRLMSVSDGLAPSIIYLGMKNTRRMSEEMHREVFSARIGIHILIFLVMWGFINILTLTWRVINYVSRQREAVYSRNKCSVITK